jgi:hypothetical protein
VLLLSEELEKSTWPLITDGLFHNC